MSISKQRVKGGQQGFTLIELMIVVAIIGILASIAIPAYQNYTIRARVSEAASVATSVKTAIGLNVSENGSLPADLDALSAYVATSTTAYTTKYVSSLSVAAGVITVTMNDIDELGEAGGQTVTMIPDFATGVAALDWRISGTVPERYRPSGI
ncbi:MAG: prepilin-type N-terminal cleavage/methylation domain-containing protein [Proteobacteria bacterium]|nr:MAG: prepilin-type N-terminal cleavage/methylation domain-containing protein [Pseudomonadota bacterium]